MVAGVVHVNQNAVRAAIHDPGSPVLVASMDR
jgi:hypothetical protein